MRFCVVMLCLSFAFIGAACGTEERGSVISRQSAPMAIQPVADLKNGPDFYNHRLEEREVVPPTLTPEGLKECYQKASSEERLYNQNLAKYLQGDRRGAMDVPDVGPHLRKAFESYVEVALQKPEVLVDVARVYEEVRKVDTGVSTETALRLHRVHPDDKCVIAIVKDVYMSYDRSFRKTLVEARYNLGIRYTAEYVDALYKKYPNGGWEAHRPDDCVIQGWEFSQLSALANAVGDVSRSRFWAIRFADYLATGHGCENGGGDIWQAYKLYAELGEDKQAKIMAFKIAQEVFENYLNGLYGYEVSNRLVRSPFLESDLELAEVWLIRSGLNHEETAQFMRKRALEAAWANERTCKLSESSYVHRKDYCDLARRQYEFTGDIDNAKRMTLLAQN